MDIFAKKNMATQWNSLHEAHQLDTLVNASVAVPQLIFKHSTRCALSAVALGRLEKSAPLPRMVYYLVDVIRQRALSQAIAEKFNVHHESPQVLLIHKGECIYEESHLSIDPADIAAHCTDTDGQSL